MKTMVSSKIVDSPLVCAILNSGLMRGARNWEKREEGGGDAQGNWLVVRQLIENGRKEWEIQRFPREVVPSLPELFIWGQEDEEIPHRNSNYH